jgi:hypothetical protein
MRLLSFRSLAVHSAFVAGLPVDVNGRVGLRIPTWAPSHQTLSRWFTIFPKAGMSN